MLDRIRNAHHGNANVVAKATTTLTMVTMVHEDDADNDKDISVTPTMMMTMFFGARLRQTCALSHAGTRAMSHSHINDANTP